MTEQQKNAAISRMILAKVAEGMTPAQALDAICGAGMYDRLVSSLYDALRAKAGL